MFLEAGTITGAVVEGVIFFCTFEENFLRLIALVLVRLRMLVTSG
jgi:hypothetical protein